MGSSGRYHNLVSEPYLRLLLAAWLTGQSQLYAREYANTLHPTYTNGLSNAALPMINDRSKSRNGSSNSTRAYHSQPSYWTSHEDSPVSLPHDHSPLRSRQYTGREHASSRPSIQSHSGDGRSSNSQKPSPPSSGARYTCLYPGCDYTAARSYDLERHVKTHYPESVERLDCPYARGGFCGRMGARGFTREDHRKEHIRKVHPSA
ncbi:MAG: hypothetical protein Q9191_006790, partial [Dirinaria sp. TL-2023a]